MLCVLLPVNLPGLFWAPFLLFSGGMGYVSPSLPGNSGRTRCLPSRAVVLQRTSFGALPFPPMCNVCNSKGHMRAPRFSIRARVGYPSLSHPGRNRRFFVVPFSLSRIRWGESPSNSPSLGISPQVQVLSIVAGPLAVAVGS